MDGKLTVGKIDVSSYNYAYGIKAGNVTGEIHADNITVRNPERMGGDAYGIVADFSDAILEIGSLNVSANGADAMGIYGGGSFTLKGNTTITVDNENFAIGIYSDSDADITIDGRTTIDVIGSGWDCIGIESRGDLNLRLTDGSELINKSGTVVGGNLTITGNGRADLGALEMSGYYDYNTGNYVYGNMTIGNNTDKVTVAFDIADSYLGNGVVTINDNTTLEVYGDTEWYDEYDMTINGTVSDSVKFVNKAEFTDWSLDHKSVTENSIVCKGLLSKANLSDGFLAAMTIHNRYAAWNAVRDRMISGSGHAQNGYRGQDPCEAACDSCDPCGVGEARNVWINYIGRGDSYQSSYNRQDWELTMNGAQVGADLFRTRRTQLGVLFGCEGGKMTNANDRIEADDTYLGVYAAQILRNGADVRGSFAYGWQSYDMNRYAYAGPLYTSSFNGRTSETNVEIGKRFARGAWSVRPVFGVDVTTNDLKAAREEVGGVGYDKTNLTQVFLRIGSDLRYQVKRFTFNSGLYYAYEMNGKELSTCAYRVGTPTMNAMLVGSKMGRNLLTFNVGGSYQVGKNISVFGGYEGQYTLDGDSKSAMNAGYVGGGWKW
jgi:hypothetical protein